ncbi:MAG TPA: hypothetical protein VL945_00450 [Candidatus Saccharimonadales bacterium]|nr:hypothetical protein [Candidatus Saccharimonadales bacterium]
MVIEVPSPKPTRPGRLLILKNAVTSPAFLILLVVAAAVYYLFIKYMITISSQGVFLVTAPWYLLYILSATSALLLTVSAYSIHISLKYSLMGLEDGAASAVTTFIGSLVTSCGCSAPILAVILYGIGVNAIGVSGAITFIAVNQAWLLGAVSLVNLLLTYHSLGKVSKGCKITRTGRITAR